MGERLDVSITQTGPDHVSIEVRMGTRAVLSVHVRADDVTHYETGKGLKDIVWSAIIHALIEDWGMKDPYARTVVP
jgi:hypothetical protein